VWIPEAWTVTIDEDTARVHNIIVEGILRFDNKYQDVTLNCRFIQVLGGYIKAGSSKRPFISKATINFFGKDRFVPVPPHLESIFPNGLKKYVGKSKAIWDSGNIQLYGEKRVSWVKLEKTALAGTKTLELSEPVDWRPGEEITISAGRTKPRTGKRYERRIVHLVDASGTKVVLTEALEFSHESEIISEGGKHIDVRCSVGLITRNIRLTAEVTSGSAAQEYGISFMTRCATMMKAGWKSNMADFLTQGRQTFCSRGPILQGVMLQNFWRIEPERMEPDQGSRISNMKLTFSSVVDGQGRRTEKFLYRTETPPEQATFMLHGKTEIRSCVIVNTVGFDGSASGGIVG
jgi:hypothetical protein